MIDVFIAKKIITMNPSWPIATAVAVRDGSILEVGTLESLQPWLKDTPYRIRDEFTDAVIMPGLIDPHLHPVMAAVLLPMQFITALPWDLPWGATAATVTPRPISRRCARTLRAPSPFSPGAITGTGTGNSIAHASTRSSVIDPPSCGSAHSTSCT